jgi:hypothetical protein
MEKREPVAPGGLAEIGPKFSLPIDATDRDRRLALAKWITDPKLPLPARVMVNRLWHYHFGCGIVDTPGDFGRNGGKPSHSDLLDWLAAEFVEHNWGMKHIHRLIVTSATYRQSSAASPRGIASDAGSGTTGVYIDDTPNISAMELRTKARRLQAEAGLDLVIVDYLQLMQATTTNRDANRVQEVSEISRGLKALARELSIPVIALSQLSRQPEMRESKEPRLSDLRESGAIEQDADLVMFLWRDKERGQDDQEQDGEVVNLRLAKHRNGPTGEIQLWFKKKQTRFVSYAADRYAEAG